MRFLFWGDATKGDVYPLVIVDTDPSRGSGMKSNTYNLGGRQQHLIAAKVSMAADGGEGRRLPEL
jgi:hypothetical protein